MSESKVGMALITECCNMAIGPDCRFCPKCGYEARVSERTRLIREQHSTYCPREGMDYDAVEPERAAPERIWIAKGGQHYPSTAFFVQPIGKQFETVEYIRATPSTAAGDVREAVEKLVAPFTSVQSGTWGASLVADIAALITEQRAAKEKER